MVSSEAVAMAVSFLTSQCGRFQGNLSVEFGTDGFAEVFELLVDVRESLFQILISGVTMACSLLPVRWAAD